MNLTTSELKMFLKQKSLTLIKNFNSYFALGRWEYSALTFSSVRFFIVLIIVFLKIKLSKSLHFCELQRPYTLKKIIRNFKALSIDVTRSVKKIKHNAYIRFYSSCRNVWKLIRKVYTPWVTVTNVYIQMYYWNF